jgi:hypothetical protein
MVHSLHVTYGPGLWHSSAENDISGVHRQLLINQQQFVIRKPISRTQIGSHGGHHVATSLLACEAANARNDISVFSA